MVVGVGVVGGGLLAAAVVVVVGPASAVCGAVFACSVVQKAFQPGGFGFRLWSMSPVSYKPP